MSIQSFGEGPSREAALANFSRGVRIKPMVVTFVLMLLSIGYIILHSAPAQAIPIHAETAVNQASVAAENTTVFLPLLAAGPVIRGTNTMADELAPQDRVLDVTSDETTLLTIDQYYSLYRYGATQQFFNFGGQNAVMVVRFDVDDLDFEPTISINLFALEQSATEIGKWINNQHSDALYPDAPEPTHTAILDSANSSVANSELIDQTVGENGDEYDNYQVEYSVNGLVDSGKFELAQFNSETVVHIRTKDGGPEPQERQLDITRENVEREVVDSYFTVCTLYGPTMHFYHMPDQNAVVHVVFSNSDISFEPEISIHLFALDATSDQIRAWINNQHSDAQLHDAAEPIFTRVLEDAERTLNEVNYVERVVGPYGQEYADYQVSYTVAELTLPEQFQLMGFDQEATVHIQTKACFVAQATPRERVLDVSSDDAEIFSVDRYFSPCQYGPTQQFFNFGEENAVMVARFNIDDPDFEPTILINIFSPELNATEIGKWINNQHSDGLYADAPEPIYTTTLDSANYSITSSEFIDHTVGTFGDEYDNYRVQYSVNEVIESENFRLIQFDSETVVHIQTKECGS